MKRRVSLQLSEQLIERLQAAARRSGTSKTAIIATALDRFLDPSAQTTDDATVQRRLDWMCWKLDQLDRTFNPDDLPPDRLSGNQTVRSASTAI